VGTIPTLVNIDKTTTIDGHILEHRIENGFFKTGQFILRQAHCSWPIITFCKVNFMYSNES